MALCYACYSHEMTRTIAHRELRNNSAAVLRAVQSGETFEVTNHGEVVAVLTPPALAPLAGVRFRPALNRGGFSDLPMVTSKIATGILLDELREER